jgi:hypothetical protein
MVEGLCFGGFPRERQNVRLELNRERFRALYGVRPKGVQVVQMICHPKDSILILKMC